MSTDANTPARYESSQVLDMRANHESAFPAIAELRKIDPSQMATEKAAHMATFDKSMADQGVTIPPPPDLVARRLHESHMVAHDGVKPESYQITFASPEHITRESLDGGRQFASAMRFSPELGGAMLSRISELTATLPPELTKHPDPEELRRYAANKRGELVRFLRSEELADATMKKARMHC